MAANVKTKALIEKELAELKKKYDNLVRNVTEGVMAHGECEGCYAGKVEFLEGLGLDVPKMRRSITIELDVVDDWSNDELVDEIDRELNNPGYYGGAAVGKICLSDWGQNFEVVSVKEVK